MLFSALPIELQNEVLLILDGVSLARADCVCKIWHELLSRETYNIIWRQKCLCEINETVLMEVTGIENIMVFQQKYGKRTSGTSTHVWKTIYKRWYIARKVGKWPVMEREIQAHNAEICDMKICGDIVYTAGVDGIIKCWDSWTGSCLNVFRANHLRPVTTIALFPAAANQIKNEPHQPKFLLSGSEDHTISIWDLEAADCKGFLRGHNNTVSCVVVYRHLVVSASFDQTIKLWDLQKDPKSACIKTLKGHCSPVTSLSVWKMKALSVSCNAIKLWSLESGECLHTVEGDDYVHKSMTQGCALRDNHALVLKSNGELKFCDFLKPCISSSGDEVCCNYTLLNYSATQCSRLSCLATYGNLMAVASYAGVVYLFHYQKDWSEKLSNILHKVKCGHGSISCAQLSCDNEGPMLVTASSDGVVKLFRWFSPSID